MNLKRIENMIRIAEERNISRAAEKLFISQPALNLQLLAAEKDVGARLFIRRGNEWSITDAGRIYIEACRKIVAIKKDAYARISDIEQLHTGEIAIGAAGLEADYMMTAVYDDFHQKFPHVKLQLNIMKGLKTQELVKNGTIDLGIILMGDEKAYKLNYDLLAHVEIVLAISQNSRFLQYIEKDEEGNEVIELSRFSDVPFVLGPKDSTERIVAQNALNEAGIYDPQIYMDVEGINYQMAMVRANECCALINENHRKRVPEGVRIVRLRSHPVMCAYAVYREDKYLSDSMAELISLIRRYWIGEQ